MTSSPAIEEDEFEEFEEIESLISEPTAKERMSLPEEEVPKCRFCWMQNADKQNPLLTTCKCSGSVGYIHFNCLKNWLDVKKQ